MSFTTTDGDLLQEGPVGWQRPVPLGRMREVPGLPLALLPGWLGEWAAAVADSVQVPADVPALVGLTVAAAGVARKLTGKLRRQNKEQSVSFRFSRGIRHWGLL